MGIRDKHDPRECGFRHFAKLDANGNVVAIVEVLDSPDSDSDGQAIPREPKDSPLALHVDITDLHPYDFTGVKTTKANVTAKNKGAIRSDLESKNKVSRG